MSDVVARRQCGRRNRIPDSSRGRPRCAACHGDLPRIVDADVDDVVDTDTPVLVDLWAPWCGPCRTLAPTVRATADELAGQLSVVKVNVDLAPATSARDDVRGIPTLLLVNHGEVLDRKVGALPADRLLAWARTATAAGRAER